MRSVSLGEKRNGVGTCPGQGASGVTRFLCYSVAILCYLSLSSLLSFLRLLYLSGREVSKERMRGVTELEVDWASEEAPGLAEPPPLNLVFLQDMQEGDYPEEKKKSVAGQFAVKYRSEMHSGTQKLNRKD